MVTFSMEIGSKRMSLLVRLERELKSGSRTVGGEPDVHEWIRCRFVESCEASLLSYEEVIHEGDAAVCEEILRRRYPPL